MKQNEIDWESLPPTQTPIKVLQAIARCPTKWQKHILFKKALADEDIPDWVLPPIDYGFAPRSYWAAENLQQLVANIKGAERKKIALQLIEEGRLDEANGFVLADSLSEEERTLTGKIHPSLMGGEYLPDYDEGAVEIARITLASTTQDVISIRAFPTSGGIGYEVAD